MQSPRPRRREEALAGIKASRARLINEAVSRKKETSHGTFTTKKVKTLPDDALKVDYELVARTALQNVQQELATKEVEQWVRCELENTESAGNWIPWRRP